MANEVEANNDFSDEQLELYFDTLERDVHLRGGENEASWKMFADSLNDHKAGVVQSAEDWKEKWLRDQVQALDALKNYTNALDNRLEPDLLARTDMRVLQILKKTIPQRKRGRPKKRKADTNSSNLAISNEIEVSVKKARLEDSIEQLTVQLTEYERTLTEVCSKMTEFEKSLKKYLKIVGFLATEVTEVFEEYETDSDSSS